MNIQKKCLRNKKAARGSGCKMKKRVICFVFSSIVLSSCSFQQSTVGEKKFITEGAAGEEIVSEPMSVEAAKSIVPFSFQVPTFLPYEVTGTVQATVRGIGKKKIVVDIEYEPKEKNRREYIELTVANFSYNFPVLVEQNRFHEKVKMKHDITAYFKNRDEEEDFATLTWKEGNLEYQLLYRNIAEGRGEEVKQNLIYIASKMEEKN